ncbi:HU family DNA-binding protein [Eubacterium sp. BX4]|uniref:HU family DNA-binding protein n=1 Tax=Eubacterium segne TaxID=2763045 RepID=A0ABR7F1A7_9FIRM|nr:HU family DNA-binding protein [Eubacterium segne]MBC5667402.1 HU family DNA-binding protein [Eubacterium segne]
MNKDMLLKEIANRIEGATKSDINVVLDTFEDVIFDTLKADSSEKVKFGKLGAFSVKAVPAKDGISAINGKPWHTDAHNEIKFTMSKTNKNI